MQAERLAVVVNSTLWNAMLPLLTFVIQTLVLTPVRQGGGCISDGVFALCFFFPEGVV